MLVLGWWEAKAAHTRLRGTTVSARPGDGIPNTSIGEPAGVTAVQPCEFPGGVELSNFGDLRSVLLTRLLSLSQVHLVRGLKIVDSAFKGNTFIVMFRLTSCRLDQVLKHFHVSDLQH